MAEYCVTGGTGLIAAHLVKTLLEQGHIVRTTVRDPGDVRKVGFLLEFNGADQRLKIMKADLMVEGSFDEAVQGVDGVFHTASPVVVTYDANIQETLIDPSIKGTLNVLSSCSKASSVKRVVLTSSCSSIRYRGDANQVSHLNESQWSDPEYCKRHNLWYAYAKTLAEKEAWRIAEQSGMDLVVVNPSFVVGPLLSPQPTSSLLLVLDLIKGVAIRKETTPRIAWTQRRSSNWAFFHSRLLIKCLTTALEVSKRRDFCEVLDFCCKLFLIPAIDHVNLVLYHCKQVRNGSCRINQLKEEAI